MRDGDEVRVVEGSVGSGRLCVYVCGGGPVPCGHLRVLTLALS